MEKKINKYWERTVVVIVVNEMVSPYFLIYFPVYGNLQFPRVPWWRLWHKWLVHQMASRDSRRPSSSVLTLNLSASSL